MLVYVSNFDEFSDAVKRNRIATFLEINIKEKLGIGVGPGEVNSWRNSLQFMRNAFELAELSPNAGIAVEFQIPLTSKRIDVLVSGRDSQDRKNVVIVELKQWQSAQATDKDGIVKTILGGSLVETTHPSYQAWSYATFIEDYNEAIQEREIQLRPCSYLHNCTDPTVLRSDRYVDELEKAPLFIGNEVELLGDFVSSYIHEGDESQALHEIDSGQIRPSKQLIEYLTSLLNGNDEFVLLDEQKIAAETVLTLEELARRGNRQVLIVEGGPGTGKSVLAINLLAKLTAKERLVQYVTRNNAPREVFKYKLTSSFRRNRIDELFKQSGRYIEAQSRSFDALLVDEAHRLSPKSGHFGHLGENQVKEIVNAANLSVFFLDEDQQVLLNDIGSRTEIERWASHFDAEVTHIELASQFRCNGSDGYIAWVNRALQIKETANLRMQELNYDFQVFDSPNDVFDRIKALRDGGRNARVVAGYCWDWISKRDSSAYDIVIPEHNFEKRWNLAQDRNTWIVQPNSINEIGCIHTCQGLELEFVGVIIGDDFVVRDNEVITDVKKRAKADQSSTTKGYISQMKTEPIKTKAKLDRIIKNTYRTLLTRGMKGCYIYCTDQETSDYFKTQLTSTDQAS